MKKLLGALLTCAAFFGLPVMNAHAEKVLRIASTLSDIPLTTGQASHGVEGVRFFGITLYDSLIRYDLSRRDVASQLVPSLATSWKVDEATHTKWTFKLRSNVKFHDGSVLNSQAITWNLEKLLKKDAPQYDQAQATQAVIYLGGVDTWRAVDPLTVEITTKKPNANFPYQMAQVAISSPARWKELGGDWNKFATKPSGSGPWMLDKVVPRERAELVRNPNYWDTKRIPKVDRLVILTMPDPTTRVAALLSGQVDWVEAPPADAIQRMKSSGMQIVTNVYPHIWPFMLNLANNSPFNDVRVRKAANLAIDRDGIVKFLGGTAIPAKGEVDPKHPWFGKPTFDIKFDPEAAKKLMAEAGYGPNKKAKITLLTSTSGSGQIQPLPMSEFIQENLNAVGFDVKVDVLEWEAVRARRRAGAAAPENKNIDGLNNSWAYWEPDFGLIGIGWSDKTQNFGYNWGEFKNAKVDELSAAAKVEFNPAKQLVLLQKLHAELVDQAIWLWVVHDMNPRALSPKVKGFVQAQSWLQDLTTVTID